jgi:hypothetical protein
VRGTLRGPLPRCGQHLSRARPGAFEWTGMSGRLTIPISELAVRLLGH